jgi:hypothetical protein
MKTPEDEAFEDIDRRQRWWGGGFPAKRAMAADKFIAAEERKVGERYGYVPKLHPSEWMDESAQEPVARVLQIIKELRPAIKPMEGMGKGKTTAEWFDILVKEIERIQPAQEEAIYGMNQDDWKDVVAAITKVRDGGGIYLGCRPADVFQEWFLALGTAKVKEKNT